MRRSDLIQKSIRFPADLVQWIEDREGIDFSKKLVELLLEVKDGEASRLKRIQQLEDYILDYEKRCLLFSRKAADAEAVFCRMESVLKDVRQFNKNWSPSVEDVPFI